MDIKGNIIDILNKKIYFGSVEFSENRISKISKISEERKDEHYILPGFIDAHIHIESSMLTPSNFARLAVVHGTIATVSDPHEIANVLGVKGVKYMIEDGKKLDFYFAFGAPSCVPATKFETAGAIIDANQIEELLQNSDVYYLAEMMNFPGVLLEDKEVLKKIESAKKYKKPIDGHAPGLRGSKSAEYFSVGISTDHECFSYEEAEEKLKLGVKILIREGSAAKNFAALIPLARQYSESMMFCSDDKHPDDLAEGHINQLVKRAVTKNNIEVFDALKMACINPHQHYNLKSGLLNVGDFADFIVIKNLSDFNVKSTYIKGKKVAENGETLLPYFESTIINNFNTQRISEDDLKVKTQNSKSKIKVIEVLDGQLITNEIRVDPLINGNEVVSDVDRDLLKLVLYNRYFQSKPIVGFINGFGLKKGALASSVAHDSHNVIAVGTNDFDIANAINEIIDFKGGISTSLGSIKNILPLPIAGLMSSEDGYKTARDYTYIDQYSKEILGSKLSSPFMSLSFMALLVIPSLKISDKGLFDGHGFEFVNLFE
jgi:adenine deaminase